MSATPIGDRHQASPPEQMTNQGGDPTAQEDLFRSNQYV
jgi:hypothetical protein